MAGWNHIQWGARNMVTWLVFILSILIIMYLLWLFFYSGRKIGEPCLRNEDCKSRICYTKDTRHLRYCTNRCGSDADCPEGWKCLLPPGMPQGMYVCLRR